MPRILLLVLVGLSGAFAAACGSAPAPPPFKPVTDVKQLMQTLIDPAADVIWEASGSIITAQGIEERKPKNQEEWDAVRNSAVAVAEGGNLLMMAPRAKDGDAWMKLSAVLVDKGAEAMKAAEARNVDAIFTVGGEIYEACRNCHNQYMEASKEAK